MGPKYVSLSDKPLTERETLTVDGRELFFERETGRYDGFGGMQIDAASCKRAGDFGSSPARA